MGTKERKRSRSRSRSPSSDSSPERQRKKEKKHSKHKHKHKKHKKRGSPDADDEKLLAAKAFLEQHLKQAAGDNAAGAAAAAAAAATPAGGGRDRYKDRSKDKSKEKKEKVAGALPAGLPLLTPDDYFERAAEFTAWLQEIKLQYFNELTTEESHALFKQFAEAWNGGQLPLRFYQGLAAAPLKRTSHNWGIKAKQGSSSAAGSIAAASGAQLGMAGFLQDQKQQHTETRAAARAGDAADKRVWRREQKEMLDDLLPKPTGGTHEARVEARMARREAAREGSPDLVPVTGGGDMMGGGGDDSFAAAKAREAKRQEWRSRQSAAKKEQLAGKLSAAAAAEADKMAQFRALVAAQGGRITIAKRD